ncbi:hypothetical protein EV191_1011112 [Tamaricihabitans halophyticus]|uniref:DUF485 domain-containing protein n=1 Tax=Tamaricihabitans halophyticus TaxID=1262583 RepID=A0A4R2R2Z7_9PSEU|nr:hypothetical protein [Tamaricihabitans halophyticus]TCP57160.1 hypothetical protein EV191_1011112 [Tamaricihabitans halophyticus]
MSSASGGQPGRRDEQGKQPRWPASDADQFGNTPQQSPANQPATDTARQDKRKGRRRAGRRKANPDQVDPYQLGAKTSGSRAHTAGKGVRAEQDNRDGQAESRKPPRRKRVVLADPRAPVTALRTVSELEQQTTFGEWLIKDLVRIQLRLALAFAALVIVLLGALPLVFYLAPAITQAKVVGVPVPWLLLGVLPFPLLVSVGLWYNRRAERHERDFVDMVEN